MVHRAIFSSLFDGCEVCLGVRGGVPGNENIIKDRLVCDYCHADMIEEKEYNDTPTT